MHETWYLKVFIYVIVYVMRGILFCSIFRCTLKYVLARNCCCPCVIIESCNWQIWMQVNMFSMPDQIQSQPSNYKISNDRSRVRRPDLTKLLTISGKKRLLPDLLGSRVLAQRLHTWISIWIISVLTSLFVSLSILKS